MKPEDLTEEGGFTPAWVLEHADVAAGLRPYIWARSPVSRLYLAANLAALILAAWAWARSGTSAADGFSWFCLGMCGGFLALLPWHEGAHAVAYRWAGARSVRVEYQWRTLTAHCVADRFVTSGRALAWICLAPFLALNPPLAAAAWLAPGRGGLLAAGALLLHVGACSGDFGLVNWLWLHGGRSSYCYDDVAGGRTYFYRRTEPGNLS